jgi:predicted O-methyltransferase YrrM
VNVEDLLLRADADLAKALAAATEEAQAEGLPDIQVSPLQGKLLHLLVAISGARSVLEIGTLGGYSTIWLASALPEGGRVISLEVDPRHVAVARRSLDRAGLGQRVDVVPGRAVDTLPTLVEEAPFDFVFIDADKPSNPLYLQWAVRYGRPGTVIVVDNVVRQGKVLDVDSAAPDVQGTRQLLDLMAADPRLSATLLQTVGGKGYDGLAVARVVSPAP